MDTVPSMLLSVTGTELELRYPVSASATAAGNDPSPPSTLTCALGGVAIALVPGAPKLEVDPALMLALFVAPVLLDAAYDTSVRELRARSSRLQGESLLNDASALMIYRIAVLAVVSGGLNFATVLDVAEVNALGAEYP
jgi:NhaP-type Na+/H+ or K+/H+ antiporter